MSRAWMKGAVALLALVAGANLARADVIDAQSQQTIKEFINRSGSALTSGTAVVFDFASASDVTGASKGATSTVGIDVTTTTVLSSRLFVGIVVDDSCANNTQCRVVTNGPALARFACSTALTDTLAANVGTSTVAGLVGSGSRAGVMLSKAVGIPNNTQDGCLRWIWVDPDIGSP